ncbi:MAG TPA: peptidyl-alpha-hydroxyglycine alpha-amidating lyase family protein [Vicinamibacterales bacterium]|nr:peptidyl-alpha-hydroxyglycine alpha-amidating lyase family protein [Vicinamibacterales bacterium]
MTKRISGTAGALALLLTAVSLAQAPQQKGGGDEFGPYELVANWPENPCGEGYQFGSTAGIFAQTPDRVFIFQRGCLPALTDNSFGRPQSLVPSRNASGFDLSRKEPERRPRWDHSLYIVNRAGKMIDSWEQHNTLFVRPHKVLISPYDPEQHVWLVDDGAHMVYKFTNDGKKLVMQLGEFGVEGNDEKHFARPTDIAWLPDGTFFVSDGYTNTRVVKFDKNGKFLLTWGQKGTPPNETRPSYMNTVHSIAIDAKRRVYVADRANSRIQIFDENGKFLDVWPNVRRPYYIYMSQDQHLWVSDGITQKFTKFDLTGKLLYSWGTFGAFPGGFWGVHQFSVDSEGNLYTADVHIGRPQKFAPRRGVDPSQLVGKPVSPRTLTSSQ